MLNTVAQLKYPTHFTGSVAGLSSRYKWQDEMSKNIVFGGNIKMNLEKQMIFYRSSVESEFSKSKDGIVPDVVLFVANLVDEELQQRVDKRVLEVQRLWNMDTFYNGISLTTKLDKRSTL
jgi:hypothetical protein